MEHLEGPVMATAIAMGVFAAAAVMFAFFKPLRRFVAGSREFPDALGAGIWIRSVGTIAAGTAAIMRMREAIWSNLAITIYLCGWALVIAGYYLHFSAWHAAYFNRRSLIAGKFLLAIIGWGAVSFWIFRWGSPLP